MAGRKHITSAADFSMVKTKLLIRCYLGMANVVFYNRLPLMCYFQLQKPFVSNNMRLQHARPVYWEKFFQMYRALAQCKDGTDCQAKEHASFVQVTDLIKLQFASL